MAGKNNSFIAALIACVVLGCASASFAADGRYIPLTDAFRLNSFVEGGQGGTDSCTIDGYPGAFVAVWQSDGQDGNQQGIVAQRRLVDGTPVGTEFVVNSYTSGRQYAPALSVHGDGAFVVVWTSERDSTTGLFAQRFDSSGARVGSEFAVTENTGGRFEAAVAVRPGGSFVVVWQSRDPITLSYDVVGRRFGADGAALGTEFLVNSETASSQQHPALSADGLAGRFVVVWESDAGDGDGFGVFGQRFDAQGAKAGEQFRANSVTAGAQRYPDVALTNDDRFLVVWQSEANQDGDGSGIFAQRYEPGGVAADPEFQVNTTTAGAQSHPAVEVTLDDLFMVTWKSQAQCGEGGSIAAQWLHNLGGPIREEMEIGYASTMGGGPGLVTPDFDTLSFVWTSTSETSTSDDVFARGFQVVGLSTATSLSTTLTTNTTTTTSTTLGEGERCSQPLSDGTLPIASDCLYILRAALDLETCASPCLCAPSGTLPITATDALACLHVATGVPCAVLTCPCSETSPGRAPRLSEARTQRTRDPQD